MRQIKFRAWNKKHKMMVFFDSLKLFCVNKEWESKGSNWSLRSFFDVNKIICNEEDSELMQYTGLKDKNGVEIYEGDIFEQKFPYDGGVKFKGDIIFSDGCFTDDTEDEPLYEFNDDIEIIGNIYENPELLNKK